MKVATDHASGDLQTLVRTFARLGALGCRDRYLALLSQATNASALKIAHIPNAVRQPPGMTALSGTTTAAGHTHGHHVSRCHGRNTVSIRAFPLLPGSDRVQDYRVIH